MRRELRMDEIGRTECLEAIEETAEYADYEKELLDYAKKKSAEKEAQPQEAISALLENSRSAGQ